MQYFLLHTTSYDLKLGVKHWTIWACLQHISIKLTFVSHFLYDKHKSSQQFFDFFFFQATEVNLYYTGYKASVLSFLGYRFASSR